MAAVLGSDKMETCIYAFSELLFYKVFKNV